MTDQPLQVFAGGRIQPVGSGRDVELISPWSGRVAGSVRFAGKNGVATAVQSARAAYMAHRGVPIADRIAWMQGAAAEIENAADRIIESAIWVIGKPRRAARFETLRSAQLVRSCAAQLASFGGDTIPLDVARQGAGSFGFAQRVPYGVIGAITPS